MQYGYCAESPNNCDDETNQWRGKMGFDSELQRGTGLVRFSNRESLRP